MVRQSCYRIIGRPRANRPAKNATVRSIDGGGRHAAPGLHTDTFATRLGVSYLARKGGRVLYSQTGGLS
jgi:hypothetical protein